jgi:hypothetical protein
MKCHDEKCIQDQQRPTLLVPTKRIRNVTEKATSAAESQRPDAAVRPTKDTKAPDQVTTEIATTAEMMEETRKLICGASGISGARPAERILSQLARIQIWGQKDADDVENALAALDMMVELKPANIVEAMLTVQMVGVHEAALMFLQRATLEGQTFAGCDANANRATRLLRLFNEQLEAMARLKGKAGQQKVTVEHVHVYQGGQAVVGAVTSARTGPGERRDDETRRGNPR